MAWQDAEIRQVAASHDGRVSLIKQMAVTESAAVMLLDAIIPELTDPKLIKMATRHRQDEVVHAGLLADRLADMGVFPTKEENAASLARLMAFYEALSPVTVVDKYMAIQVVEERDAPQFEVMAEALAPHDPLTSAVFARMAKDERSHVKYCQVIARELGDASTPARLAQYREIDARIRGVPSDIYVYQRVHHFRMIESWSDDPIDPEALGNGLVIPGVCCGFVDGIGQTRTAYFYCLRANPELPLITRGKAILRLGARVIAAARGGGYTHGVTSTSNDVVSRFWLSRMGFHGNGEQVFLGAL